MRISKSAIPHKNSKNKGFPPYFLQYITPNLLKTIFNLSGQCRKYFKNRRNKINGKARDYIYENTKELKNCFRQNSKQEAIEQFKQYLQNYRAIPVVLKDFIRKHTINHFHRYVEHLDNENIEKTSNKVENYYRQTNPE